jgi:hypothetical protein
MTTTCTQQHTSTTISSKLSFLSSQKRTTQQHLAFGTIDRYSQHSLSNHRRLLHCEQYFKKRVPTAFGLVLSTPKLLQQQSTKITKTAINQNGKGDHENTMKTLHLKSNDGDKLKKA